MSQTFNTFSFGCRVNQAEMEELDRQLLLRGYTSNATSPDVFIVNTCSVTHKAEREAKQLIYQIKKQNPDTKIVVTGCAATNWAKTKQEIPEIDILVDNQNKEYLAELIEKRFKESHSELVSGSSSNEMLKQVQHDREITSDLTPQTSNLLRDKYTRSKRLILKIQDGCHRFCTYCIVPYLRGLPKSIPAERIIEQINTFLGDLNEIVLSAINTEAYGYDIKISFVSLVKEILASTSVKRVSFGSIHPWSVNDEFFTFYKEQMTEGRLVDFFHIPLQSGSNKILKLMKRGYTREEFVEKLRALGAMKPHIFLATDVIVGFLDETDSDFEDTYNFLKESPITKFHIFRFSKREHTAAAYLANRIPEPTDDQKTKRAKALASLHREKYGKFLQSHLRETFSTLFLEKTDGDLREGLLSNQIPVLVKADESHIGNIKNVKIEEYKDGKLLGRIA